MVMDEHKLLAIGKVGIVTEKQQGMAEENVIEAASVVKKQLSRWEELMAANRLLANKDLLVKVGIVMESKAGSK